MATISTLAVNLIARTSVFERGMKRGRKSLKGFKRDTTAATASLVRFAKRLLVTGAAVLALKSLASAASRAEETMNLFNTVFAENAKETAKWADDFAKNIGRSRTEVKEWAAALQDTFVPLGFARAKAAELSKSLVELAVDVASFKNVADAEVIAAFTSGIVGNHRAVRAFGIVITNATLEAESFNSGLNKTFSNLTELEKVQLRYNVIMNSTRDAQGDAAKTADAFANRIKKLQGMFVDFKEELGKKILPVISKIAGALIKNRDAIVSVTKKVILFTVKTLIVVAALNASVKAIKLTIAVIKGLAIAYKAITTGQITFLALSGPAGWIALGASIGIAIAAIIAMNKVMDKAIDKIKDINDEAEKGPKGTVLAGLPKSIAETEKEIITLRKQLGGIKETIDGAGKKLLTRPVFVDLSQPIAKTEKEIITLFKIIQGIKRTLVGLGEGVIERSIPLAILQKRLDNSKKHLLLLLEQRDIQGDIALAELKQAKAAEKKQTAFAKLMSSVRAEADNIIKFVFDKIDADAIKSVFDLSEQAKKLKETLQTPAEKLSKVKDKLSDMFQRGFLTAKEFTKALKSARDNLIPEAPTDTATGRFQQIRSAFIDVAALNPTQTPTAELVKLNDKTEKTNFLLEELNRNSIGVHET